MRTPGKRKVVLRVDEIKTQDGSVSQITRSDFTNPVVAAVIDEEKGGDNKCWGQTATYIAGEDIMAGRVLTPKIDNEILKAYYSDSKKDIILGISQHNATAGEPITICTSGYSTAVIGRGIGMMSPTDNHILKKSKSLAIVYI